MNHNRENRKLMLKFLKENSYSAVKMFVNQVAMALFGLMISFAAATMDDWIWIAGTLVGVFLYLFLAYNMFWEMGAKDRTRVDAGREKAMPLKGLYIDLISNIPSIVVCILMLFGYYLGSNHMWAGNLYVITSLIARVLQAMYLGLIQLFSPYNPWGIVLTILPVLAMSAVAYQLGFRNFRILSLFGIDPNKKKNK